VSKTGDRFPLHRNPVLVDLLLKRLAESNYVLMDYGTSLSGSRVWTEPESHPIEEVKTGEVNDSGAVWPFVCSKKDGGREDPLKASDQAAIVRAVFGQVKEVEDLRSRPKPNYASLLSHRKGGDPDGDQTVLTEGDGPFIMHLPQ
jgi:hypothetical protein